MTGIESYGLPVSGIELDPIESSLLDPRKLLVSIPYPDIELVVGLSSVNGDSRRRLEDGIIGNCAGVHPGGGGFHWQSLLMTSINLAVSGGFSINASK
jgi:hypothetical protein